MKLTPKIQRAINVAAEKHIGQKRKSTKRPFIVHPFSVACILSEFTTDEDVICAGLLHDTLEDVKGYTFLDIKRDFGLNIAEIVREVSENKAPGGDKNKRKTWEERKIHKLHSLRNASREAMMVSAADKIHNLKSLEINYIKQGESFWRKFNASPEKKFWYYGEVVKIIRDRLDGKITEELISTFREALDIFIKNHDFKKHPRREKAFSKIKEEFLNHN